MDKIILFEYINSGEFNKESLNDYLSISHTDKKALLKDTFHILSDETKKIHNRFCQKKFIENMVRLIVFLCDNESFNEQEIEYYRKKIKRNREKMLVFLKSGEDQYINKACNLLDEIVLDKSIKDKDLIKLIKVLIDKNTEVAIIKKVINVNRGCILIKNNSLFDYVFDRLMIALNEDSREVYYYITLLKIVYYSELDKFPYIYRLKETTSKDELLIKEIYNIICGNKRFLSLDEIMDKYNISSSEGVKIKIGKKSPVVTDDLTVSIDSKNTIYRDDAFSIKKDGNKYIVKLHVADVGGFLNQNGEFDKISKRNLRNSYLYYKGTNILCKSVSNKLSLSKGQIRKAISLIVILNDYGEVIDYSLENNDIVVNENLSMSDSNNILYSNQDSSLKDSLKKLMHLSNALYNNSKRKNMIHLPTSTDYKNDSEMIVGEFSILYNTIMAKHAYDSEIPFVYKAQEDVMLDKLVESLKIPISDTTRNTFNSLYTQSIYTHSPSFNIRTQEDVYAQCTSPIRRYPDIYNQYLIHMFLLHNKDFDFNEEEHRKIIEYFNQRDLDLRLFEQEYNREYVLSQKMKKNQTPMS